MKLFSLLAALALLTGLALPAHADFPTNGLQMGASYCPGSTADCSSVIKSQSAAVDMANQCINTRFNIADHIMSEFRMSGEYENCVVPSQVATSSDGTSVWAICCYKKDEGGNSCNMYCTRYIAAK